MRLPKVNRLIYNSRNYLRLIATQGEEKKEIIIYNSRNYLRLIAFIRQLHVCEDLQ